jgi:hypothetical protein
VSRSDAATKFARVLPSRKERLKRLRPERVVLAQPPCQLHPHRAAPTWLPLYPGSKPEGLSVVTDPQTGNRVGSYFFCTSDEIEQVHDFYEDKMTQATWSVSRAPTQVWGSSDAEGRKFEITPQLRGDDTHVRVNFEERNRSEDIKEIAANRAAIT